MNQISNIQDKKLIELYQKNNNQEFLGQLFTPYRELVYGVCLKYFKNKQDAEDGLMSVYEIVSKKLKTHQVENFKSWLYIVTKNHCLEKLRKRSKDIPKEKEAADMYSGNVFHLDTIDKEKMLNKLGKCMQTLVETQRQCIRMFYYEKKSYQEVAAANGISWSKVRSYIQNGRRMLKKCMES